MARADRLTKAIGVIVLLLALVGGGLAIRSCYLHRRGVEVRLRNVENIPLRSVTVAIRGDSYAVGDLAPGATASVWVKPTSECTVEVSYASARGEVKPAPLGDYIEPGYGGWISADLTATEPRDVIDAVEDY